MGILYPEIYEMQVRAIIEASIELIKQGFIVKPEIMIPLVSHSNELKLIYRNLKEIAGNIIKKENRSSV